MSSSKPKTFRGIALAAALFACVITGCDPMDAAYGGGDDYPSDAYIGTTDPVYFEGHAAYWYGGRWSYRDGGRWNHYDHEPAGLAQRRGPAAPQRRTYESGRGRSVGRSGGRAGGGRR